MPDMPDQTEIDKWHHWFAAECNNRAWDLAEKAERSADEDREMLLAAYAATFHWSKTGKPINEMRADFLLGHTLALSGDGVAAMKHARRCLDWCEAHSCEDWDIAFAHAGLAHAAAFRGDAGLHAEHFARAGSFGRAIKDSEDRKVFLDVFSRLPVPAAASDLSS